jgi:zinc/manganese transport system substrate-binding protein
MMASRFLGPLLLVVLILLGVPALGETKPVPVVAAENFYGDMAAQIGGRYVDVSSILLNPDQDPHLFEASPSVARSLSAARIVIYNGANYDAWMRQLLSAARSADRQVIVAADLLHKKPGDNPHLWYDPSAMRVVARAVAESLQAADPLHGSEYRRGLASFLDSVKPLDAMIAAMRERYAGLEVAATEPVFGYMADALGLRMRNGRFQLAVMNGTEPRASDIAAFEDDLRQCKVRALIYNSQATNNAARRLLRLAGASGVATVGVTETEPPGKLYQEWMLDQLRALDRALAQSEP